MIGKTVAQYKIIQLLGQGGMGVVFKAEDLRLGRIVALKVLPLTQDDDSEEKRRFTLEARAASAIQHPNICTIYDIDQTESNLMYIVMALYEGETLKDRLDRGEIPPDEFIGIIRQITAGLREAHRLGIIHRDIKPANIFLTTNGDVKILDFGLARIMGSTRLTRTGTSMGTIVYSSPEQMLGGTTDARTDIWSLGVILYEIIAGRLPFLAEHESEVIYSVLNEEPRPIAAGEGTLLELLIQIINKALEKDPAQRYADMASFRADFESFILKFQEQAV